MFCAACAASVEATLRKQPGVNEISVNFAADAAVVDWDGEAKSALLDAVASLGYRGYFIGDAQDKGHAGGDAERGFTLRLVVAVFFGMWAMLPTVALYIGGLANTSAYLLAVAVAVFSLPVIAYSGTPFYRMGIATLRSGVAGIDALVSLGVAGAVALSAWNLARGSSDVYFEVAIALITLQLVARLLDLRVRRRARDAVLGLLQSAPTTVRVEHEDGSQRLVPLNEARPGARVRLRPGDRIAVDGVVLEGLAEIDRTLISGESRPVLVSPGDRVHAGERLLDAALLIEVTATTGKRRIDSLAQQIRKSLAAKSAWQRVAELIARYFLWGSAGAALVTGVALVLLDAGLETAAVRALAVFVIACPCALSLAAPLAGLLACAAAARRGMIIRDLSATTGAAVPERLFLDKTGTVTRGRPRVETVHALAGRSDSDVLAVAALAERYSEHPIAAAICAAAGNLPVRPGDTRAVPGFGVTWRAGEEVIRVGKPAWFDDAPQLPVTVLTRVLVEHCGQVIGAIDLDDALREGIEHAVERLRERGVEIVILSGDRAAAVRRVADLLGVRWEADLTPENKLARIEEAKAAGRVVAFAGDGLNDGPALAAADLGIAVEGATDAARNAAAVAFTTGGVADLPELFALTRRTRRVIYQNLGWAIAYNGVAIPAAMLGYVHPAIAAAAMALSSIAIVLNSLRVSRRLASGQPARPAELCDRV